MAYVPSLSIDEAGDDEIVNNSRTRAIRVPITVGTVTFPASPLGVCWYNGAGSPISTVPGAASTIDIGQLLSGFIIQAPSVANTSTLDTAVNVVAGCNKISSGAQVGDVIPVYMGNGSAANTITIAAGAGGTFDANQPAAARVIPVNSSRYIFVRLTNVNPGSEAYTIYL